MYIHLNGFDFEFSNQVIASFIDSDRYEPLSLDIAGIHLTDVYQQMLKSGVAKSELTTAMLNFHISSLKNDGIKDQALTSSAYKNLNVSFLIDSNGNDFARFINRYDKVNEDRVSILFINFNKSIQLSYSETLQLTEYYQHLSQEQVLLLFLETFREYGINPSRSGLAILTATGLLLFKKQINTLQVLQFQNIEFELNIHQLLLNLPDDLNTRLLEIEL